MRWSRADATVLASATLVFVIQAAAWPLSAGRTGSTHLFYYLDFFHRDPILPALVGHPPVAPFVFGPFLEYLGGYATEALLGVCFVAAVWFLYRAGSVWGRTAGLSLAALMLVHASYGSLFHRIDSDALFAAGFAAWLYFAFRQATTPSARTYVMHGLIVGALVLSRPANQVFLAFVVYALLFSAPSALLRVTNAAAFLAAAAVVLGGWALVNKVRFGEYGSRFNNAAPLYGLMTRTTTIVGPGNGPASAAVTSAVERDILSAERYRLRGINTERFWADRGGRSWEALLVLSDRQWGWDSRYQILREVAFEAIRNHPGEYLLGVNRTFVHMLVLRQQFPVQFPRPSGDSTESAAAPIDDSVPPADTSWTHLTPDGRSPVVVGDASTAGFWQRYRDILQRSFGYRHGIPGVAHMLNTMGIVFVPMIVAVGVAILSLPFLAVRGATKSAERVLVLMMLMALGVLALSSALQPATLEYRLPFDPLFLLTAMVGGRALLHGRRILAASGNGETS